MKKITFVVIALSLLATSAFARTTCAGLMAGMMGSSCSTFSKPHWLSLNFDGGYDTYYNCSNGQGYRLSYSSDGDCQGGTSWTKTDDL